MSYTKLILGYVVGYFAAFFSYALVKVVARCVIG